MRPELLNALTLAYLGDALFEVYIREYLILEKGITKPNDLQKASVSYVSAVAQAYFMKVARESGFLTPEELAIYKRGRNTKAHNKSHSRTLTHNQSSGFEALIGHLYLKFMKQWIYGRNTVRELIKNHKASQVFIVRNTNDDLIKLCKDNHVKMRIGEKKEMISLVGNVAHQGVACETEGYDYATIEEILSSVPKGKQPCLLMLDGLEDPHNLGAILRTCDAVGVDGVIIGKKRSVSLNATVAKVSTGAIDHVKVAQVTNLTRTLDALKKQGFWAVACENENSQDYRQVDYNMPLVLVIGSEGFGISRLLKSHCDLNVVLPMVGHVTSLNASVATAVLLYQVYNSRHPL